VNLLNVSVHRIRLPKAATAKLNDVDPQGWLADVLAPIADQATG